MTLRITKKDKEKLKSIKARRSRKVRHRKKTYNVDISKDFIARSAESFSTRAELNKYYDEAEDFLNPYNSKYMYNKKNRLKNGSYISNYKANQYRKMTEMSNAMARREQQAILANRAFQEQQRKRKESGYQSPFTNDADLGTGIAVRDPESFRDMPSERTLDRQIKELRNRGDNKYFNQRTEKMKEAFISVLRGQFGENADEFANRIEKMNNRDFYVFYLQHNDMEDVFFESDQYKRLSGGRQGGDMDGHIKKLTSYLDRFERQKANFKF